ncbi:hypothetical protein [Polluticaenibacter yanchengensis]|uniref:Uncharacterized protein n=1 Tax=Polluticaenibacter yanchengensis TaxID=3014562 RepID=A0ABT4UIP4_9BACT|nr:hypothetical protein [Chitinophagaceae bacterium LY-5]
MTIDKAHDFINFIVFKEKNGYLTPPEIDMAINQGQMSVYNTLIGDWLDKNVIHNALNPFRVKKDFNTNGRLDKPADYGYITGLYRNLYDDETGLNDVRRIIIYKEDELSNALSSQVRKVTEDYPIACEMDEFIELYPKRNVSGYFTYLSKPIDVKFSFTMNGREVIYNPNLSVHPKWNDIHINKVLFKALEYLGVPLSAGELVQFANAATQFDNQTNIKL